MSSLDFVGRFPMYAEFNSIENIDKRFLAVFKEWRGQIAALAISYSLGLTLVQATAHQLTNILQIVNTKHFKKYSDFTTNFTPDCDKKNLWLKLLNNAQEVYISRSRNTNGGACIVIYDGWDSDEQFDIFWTQMENL